MGKGGVLTPPPSGFQSTVRLRPAQLAAASCAGRETEKQLEPSVTAGLKPRPSLSMVRNPGQLLLALELSRRFVLERTGLHFDPEKASTEAEV